MMNLLRKVFFGKAHGWKALEDWLSGLTLKDVGKYEWDTPAGWKIKVNVDYDMLRLRLEYPHLSEDVWIYNAKQDRWYPAAPGTPRKLPWEWTWE